MNFDALKTSVLLYIEHFGMYDYMAYAWLVFTFFIAILLTIVLARKSVIFSLLTLLFSLALLLIAPFVLKNYLDDYLRPSSAKVTLSKKLLFTNALIVKGEVHNISKKDFSTCLVETKVYKQGEGIFTKYFYKLKPFRKKTIVLDSIIKVNDFEEFKVLFDNFDYFEDINVSVNSECY